MSSQASSLRFAHALRSLLTFDTTRAGFLTWLKTAYRKSRVSHYIYIFFLLCNLRSLPLVWHFRVLRGVLAHYLLFKLLKTKNLALSLVPFSKYKSPRARWQAEESWIESYAPIGRNPLEYVVNYKSWASPDDSDFNLHLSNSCYARTLDPARYKAAFSWFPIHFHAGGWVALASTQYHFIREIPIFARYEIRMSIGSWDEKWVYLLCKFVTKSPSKSKASHRSSSAVQSSLHTVASPSLLPYGDHLNGEFFEAASEETPALNRLINSMTKSEAEEGYTLHAISISLGCFKIGRITVPPAVMLPLNGFVTPPSSSSFKQTKLNHTNPPSHWNEVQKLLHKSKGGSVKKTQAFMKGGWKDVPEDERWWVGALEGLEEQRVKNLEAFRGIRKEYDVAKAI